jgi:hypothetical protein
MNQVMTTTYFTSLVFSVDNGKGVNHNPFQFYGKFVSINKRHNFLLHLKIIWVEQNNFSFFGKEVFYKIED